MSSLSVHPGSLRFDKGPWSPPHAPDHLLVVVEGALCRHVGERVGGTSALLGPGDVLDLGVHEDSMLFLGQPTWTGLAGGRIAAITVGGEGWARASVTLASRMTQQLRRQNELIAIGHFSRVEDRVLAIMWHLAERWGTVRPDGVLVGLTLSHRLIGELVGARRPTVSLALKLLREAGHLEKSGDGWLLSRASRQLTPDLRAGRSLDGEVTLRGGAA